MNALLYPLLVVLYSGGFALVYQLLLVGRASHRFNRRFLLLSLIIPFFLPFIKLPVFAQTVPVLERIKLSPIVVSAAHQPTDSFLPATDLLLQGAYLLVAGLLLIIMVWKHVQFSQKLKHARQLEIYGRSVYVLEGFGPGSYNRKIFFPGEPVSSYILRHEEAHVRYRHYVDLWLMQLVSVIGWANPCLYYLRTKLKMVHEYEADAAAAGTTETTEYTKALLAHVLSTHELSIAHSFFHHPIKNRIIMLQQSAQPGKNAFLKWTSMGLVLVFSASVLVAQTSKPRARTAKKSNAASSLNRQQMERVYRSVASMPHFKGNVNDWLSQQLRYPEKARNAGAEGRVIIEFVVASNGSIIRPKIVRSSTVAALDAEALRVVAAMPKWQPGREKGRNVPVYFNLPITFRLE